VEEKEIIDEAVDTEETVSAEDAKGTESAESAKDTENTEETVACEEADATQESAETKKKSLFGKDKKEKKDKQQEKIDELEDRVKRQMAEFENFRKRSEKEKSAMFETGAKSVVEKILPVVDNFERGLAGLSEEDLKQPFAEGMNMVYKQLITELEKLEVKPIEAVGHEFNPELHNAVMQVESEEYESGIIAQELQKGYTYRDSVVRHSMVAVVQ
jgi:molecular chaperone GrpE